MASLSLNKAAKEAGVAKTTLLSALNSGRISAEKNDKGHWQIDPSELFRVFPRTGSLEPAEPNATPIKNHQRPTKDSALEIEVKMLREQISRMDAERNREREQLSSQIETMRGQIERQSADHRQALAVLTDQRDKPFQGDRKGFFARLKG